jgi:hypothetical protein
MSLKAHGYVASWDAMPNNLRGLAFLLADYTNADTGLCCPSMTTLARRSMATERTVRRSLAELEALGVIRRHFRYVDGRQTTTQYELLNSPEEQNLSERPDTSVRGEEDTSVRPEEDTSVRQNQEEGTRKKGRRGAKAPTLTRPSLEEVRDYCAERGNDIDPQHFIDYYDARGWKLKGGQTIKDWKACIRTWERNGTTSTQPQSPYDGMFA